jgi:hypothetical protein
MGDYWSQTSSGTLTWHSLTVFKSSFTSQVVIASAARPCSTPASVRLLLVSPAVELRLLLLLLLSQCDQPSPLEGKRPLQSLEKVT